MKKKHLNFKYLTMAGYNLFMFNLKAKVRKILVLSVMFFVSVVFAAAQQNLRAVDDYAITGPMQKVRVNVLANDTVTCSAYTLNIISNLNPATQGIATVTTDGFIDFDPALPCRNTTVTIVYGLTCNNVQVTANLTVDVTKYNLPVNIIDETLECYEIMPTGVTFSPGLKYVGKSVKNEYQDVDRLDGFSMSLVGDLNGDHKPEIIAMGITSLLDGWEATGTAIIILNGQTGAEIYRYNLSNLGGSYKLRYYPRHNSVSKLAIADLDRNGIGDIIIAETGSGGRVHRIEPVFTGTTITGMTKKWTGWTGNESNIASFKSPITGKDENTYGSPLPYIADINADGIPEVIVYNKIYNGVTGELVCTLQTLNDFDYPPQRPNNSSDISTRNTIISDYAYVGRRPGSEDDDHVPCMVIADIDGNGILDIIAGSKVYIMKDNNGKPALDSIIHGPSSITAQKGTGTSETTTYVADGFTAVADIDLDGNLDVIVLAPAESGLNSTTEQVLYVWDPLNSPATPKAATYLYTDAVTGGTMSHPFVGDINGALDDYAGTKRLPEICFNGGRFYTSKSDASKIAFHPLADSALTAGGITGASHAGHGFNEDHYAGRVQGHIVGFTYHADPNGSTPLHQRLKLCWAMEHGDESSCTGITMFDFDNDNIKELCYRDEKSLRVISPARKVYINYDEEPSNGDAIRFKYTGIESYTGFEAPVIADVNMDGSADIVTLVSKTSSASKGFVHVFEHKSGSDPWAPCPPVWNQGIYFPLLINEDLTVPARPQSMLTSYQDVNGNTIYPYNGQWIQQPIVRDGQNFVPVVRHPDAVLQDVRVKFVSGTETEVTFDIFNKGTATLSASTPISFYNGGTDGKPIESSAFIKVENLEADVFPNTKVTLTYTISGNFDKCLIWVRIMANNTVFPASGFDDCDLTNNTFGGADCPDLIYTVTASPDTVLCGTTDQVILRAVPKATPDNPQYQWYRNDVAIPEATNITYTATQTGEYKCYVTEIVCRGFSSVKILTRNMPVAIDDYVNVTAGSEILVDVMLNDNKSDLCTIVPEIVENGKNGTASIVGDKIKYKPNHKFTGKDSVIYRIDNSQATIYISVNNFPLNVIPEDDDCDAEQPPFSFKMNMLWEARGYISKPSAALYQTATPIVGDIDGDGKIEILAMSQAVDQERAICIYDGATGDHVGEIKFASTSIHYSQHCFLIVDGDKDGKAEVFVADNTAQTIYLFEVNSAPGVRPITFDTIWTKSCTFFDFILPGLVGVTVRAADLDGDGTIEFIAGNKLISYNGDELATLPFNSNGGGTSIPHVADVDGDGYPEIITGTDVSKWDGTVLSLFARCPDFPNGLNGWNMSADINMDGNIDLVFTYRVDKNSCYKIWTPVLDSVITTLTVSSTIALGFPSIGDIDGIIDTVTGKKYPEICFSGNVGGRSLYAYSYTDTGLTQKWAFKFTPLYAVDRYTPALFDFNLDGKLEIIIKDQMNLLILDGSGTGAIVLDSIPCSATPGIETPAVADVNGDGSADIIVLGPSSSSSMHVMVIEAAKSKWASAPSVWNQAMYSPLLVNRDLTVPQIVASQTLDFNQNCNGIHALYYNGGLIQPPYIGDNTFCPVDLSADVYVVGGTILTNGNQVTFTVTFGNQGNAVATAKTPIRFYKNAIAPSNVIDSVKLGVDLLPGQTVTLSKVVTLSSTESQFYVRILDDGTNFPALGPFSDCNLTNNQKVFGKLEMFKTVNSIDACTNGTSIFTIKLLNSSTQTSNNIVLVDSLGSDWEFLDAYSSVGVVGTFNPSDSKIKWVLGSLAPGDSALWHITTTAHTPGTIHNYVWIDSLGGNIVGREAIESYVIVSNFHAPSAASITPLNPIMCVGDSVLLTASFEGASAYKWYLDYVELPGGDLEGHWAKDTGKYSMIYFDGVCFSEMSNIVTVTQLDTVKGGKIGYNQNPLLGSVPEILISLVPASGGTGDFAYQWQKKEAGGFWQDINYATNPDYLPEAVEPLLYRYRRKVTSGTCAAVYSDTVIILPLRPLALEYSACQGASIEIGFVPITNEDLDWYDAQTGGQIVLNHQFRYRKNKDSTLVETYWVEQIYNGITFPRYRVDLELSPNCGVIDPTGCAATGTVLFKEDFGGNLPTDDSYKSSGIPQVLHSYGYKCSVPLENRKYCIRKQTDNNNGLWYKIDDHTFPNDTSRGYLLSVSGALGERYFYRQQIDNLCANSQLYFSFWVVSLDAVTEHNNKKYAAVNLKIKLETLDGTLLKEFAMGDVPFPDSNWKYYGTDFTVPAGHSSIVFAINNYDVSALVHGNNFAIDDIEVRFCAPPVTIEQPARLDTTLCTGTSFTFTGNYTDDGTFGSNLAYRWEHNTGDINNPDDWIFISGTEETSNTGSLTSTYTINPIEANHAGYYRLVVANEENIDNYNCRAMSEIIHLQVVPNVISGTASADQTICYNTQPAPLTSTAATGGSSFITYQWQESTDGGTVWSNVSGGTGETSLDYTPPVLTQTTKYRLMATGGTASCQRVYTNEITISVRSVCAVTDSIIASCDQILPFDVLANDIVSTGCSPVKVEIVTNPVRGNATVLGDNTIKYDGNHSGLDSLMYLVTCGGVRQDSAKVYINIKHDSAFMDDVWYYGEDAEGIRFVNNNGIYIAEDASGESKVNSHENSLVVSSPYCNGQVIFYSSHNQLYNNLHEPMTNGSFMGHQSIADGLAACYMGNNKYLFFSVTNSYEGGDRGLKAYIVDMNADHGKGAIEDSIIIEPPSNNMSESIELLAANEPHKYWLIYAYQNGTHYDLHVHKVDVEDATPVKGLTTQTAATTTSNYRPYTLKASHQHNQIALANRDLKTVDVFDFNISTGLLSNRRTTPSNYEVDGIAYGVEFSPDGNQLYAAGYTQNGGTPLLCQYTITSTSLNYVGGIQYWEHVSSLSKGGGLKLGPDGNIYVVLAYDSNVGVISNPDLMTPLSDRYSKMHLNYNPSSYALQFSTGITKPSVRECNTNLAPTTQADETVLCVSPTSETVTVNVLQNDQDIDNNNIFLTSANFVLEADTSRASLTVNAADSSITLTLKTGVNIAEGYVFEILYNIKDDGLPASQCATGLLTITVHFFPSLNSTLSPPSICSGTSFNYTATATTANATFSWSRAAVTGIDGIATGTGKTIDEVLTNTTNDSIRVTYLVTINSENCIHTDTVRVGVYAPLSGGSIIPNTAQEYCYGGVQPLIHLGTALPTGGSGNYTYQWESSTNSIDFSTLGVLTQTYEINTSLSQTTWLRRAVTDAVCGKVYSDVAQITIHPLPVISSGLTTLCVGLTTTLSPNTGGVWTSSDSSVVDIIVNGYTIEGKSAGTATLTYTSNTTGCTDNITITVNPYPDDPAEITGEKVVCIGEEIQLSNDTLGGVWMYNNSNISIDNPTANPVKVKGLSEGRSFITYTVSNGICQTKKTFRLKVIPNTPPKIIIGIER